VAHPRVTQQAFAKSINDIPAHAQVGGMEDWHGGHPLASCGWGIVPFEPS
jgi:hypothetical protein